MLETFADYATEVTDEERELGFELVEIQNSDSESIQAVVYRFSECDQIVKMNIPVIGGHSYRHERLRSAGRVPAWVPAGAVVFPTAAQAVNSVSGQVNRLQACH